MSKDTETNLFMFSPLSKHAGFYQQLLSNVSGFQELGNRLIHYAERTHALRQLDKLRQVAEILSNLPIQGYQYIGQYYLALSIHRNGKGNVEKARQILEHIVYSLPSSYRSRALLSLAAVSARKQDYDSELHYYNETIKAGKLDLASVESLRGIAILKAKEGYHRAAIRDLENLLPLAMHSEPLIYFDCLNSLAVELGEVGRKEEARNISRYVLASPFAFAYPEWQATAEDLRGASRSFVVIDVGKSTPRNVLPLPPLERDGIVFPTWAGNPGQVINYEQRKRRMAKKKKNGDKRKPIDEMNEKELIYEILHLFTSDKVTYEQRVKILQYAEKVLTEPKKPDDDKPGA